MDKNRKSCYCPDCKKPFIHRAITWTCPNCGLYLKGAVGALSYTLKELTREDPVVEREDKCPECGASIFEHDFKHMKLYLQGLWIGIGWVSRDSFQKTSN